MQVSYTLNGFEYLNPAVKFDTPVSKEVNGKTITEVKRFVVLFFNGNAQRTARNDLPSFSAVYDRLNGVVVRIFTKEDVHSHDLADGSPFMWHDQLAAECAKEMSANEPMIQVGVYIG